MRDLSLAQGQGLSNGAARIQTYAIWLRCGLVTTLGERYYVELEGYFFFFF